MAHDRKCLRREFFKKLAGAASLLFGGWLIQGTRSQEGPSEDRPLREADFYSKHDLAG